MRWHGFSTATHISHGQPLSSGCLRRLLDDVSMQLSRLLFVTALLLAPVVLVGTTWLYLYPFFDHACAFPSPPGAIAPFRLLALGDPQLEGDSSLPKPGAPVFPSLQRLADRLHDAPSWQSRRQLVGDAMKDIPKDLLRWLEGNRKRIDIWGNDYYLGHIVRTLRWWTQPTHVAVLGDLLGSQWISDEEFERRTARYWDIVFRGMERVPDVVMLGEGAGGQKTWGGTLERLGDNKTWENRVINIVGNHDIGYAGDIDKRRVQRFERAYGMVNWDIAFELPASLHPPGLDQPPLLRLVILNSMNLDTPAFDEALQRETYDFMNHVISTSRPVDDKTHATLLLTHIPFHKEAGTCVDSPFFDFFDSGHGVKEQNMISDYASKIMLEGIFGLSSNHDADGQGFGRRGIVINGHDHEGCDVLHYISQPGVASRCPQDIDLDEIHMPEFLRNTSGLKSSESYTDEAGAVDRNASDSEQPASDPEPPKWQAKRFPHLPYTATEDGECIALNHVPRIREITLRSMMGEFSGYAGFLSAWFDPTIGDKGEWKLEFSTCGLGVQHWWWGVHIVDLILVVFVFVGVIARLVETSAVGRIETKQKSSVRMTNVADDGKKGMAL